MPRGSTVTVLLALLKAELRDAQEPNTTLDTEYTYALSNKQKDFANQYDWPFLRHDWDLACAQGSRYLNIPTSDTRGATVTINFERPVLVTRKLGSYYLPITYGIGPDEWNWHEGTTQTSNSIERWQFAGNVNEAANPNQVEIWPSPSTAQTVRFSGQRVLQALSAASDTCDLDDLLLVYFVAADYLGMRDQTNAPLVLKKATDHLLRLRNAYPDRTIPRHIIGRQYWKGLSHYDRENVKLVGIA